MALLPIDPKERKMYILGLQIAGDFGIVIALPVIVLVWIGQNLDKKYNSAPWLTVIAFAVSAIVSGIIIYRKAKKYSRLYNDILDERDNTKK